MARKEYPAEHKEVKLKLSDYQQMALNSAENLDWFNPESFVEWRSIDGYGYVHRQEFVASKLFEKGYFERRLVVDIVPFFEYRYYKS